MPHPSAWLWLPAGPVCPTSCGITSYESSRGIPARFLWRQKHPSSKRADSFIASCCACCFYTRTGRRHVSLRFLTMGMRNHTLLGLLTAALLSSTLSERDSAQTGLMVAKAAALRTNINIDGRPLPTTQRRRTSSKACAPRLLHAVQTLIFSGLVYTWRVLRPLPRALRFSAKPTRGPAPGTHVLVIGISTRTTRPVYLWCSW